MMFIATGASLYWIMLLGPLFPDMTWNDPEFSASTWSTSSAVVVIRPDADPRVSLSFQQGCPTSASRSGLGLRTPAFRSTLQSVLRCHTRILSPASHVMLNKTGCSFEQKEETNEVEEGGILVHDDICNADSRDIWRYVDCARGSAYEGSEAFGVSRLLRKYPGCWKGYWPGRLPCSWDAPFQRMGLRRGSPSRS